MAIFTRSYRGYGHKESTYHNAFFGVSFYAVSCLHIPDQRDHTRLIRRIVIRACIAMAVRCVIYIPLTVLIDL